ncbi:MAG: hypothetical protein ABI609_00890 [Acidobacteriota bacterium]
MPLPRRPLMLAGSLLSALSGPLVAGDLVIPVVSNQTVEDLSYSTRLWVANPTAEAQTFTALFFPAGTDGTSDPASSTLQTAAPGVSLVYSGVPGGSGMLALRGTDGLSVGARLETRRGSTLLGSVNVPPVTGDTAFAANATAHLVGIERVPQATASDLYLFNFDNSAARCTVQFFQASGAPIAGAISLTFAPRQRRDFVDALNLIGQSSISDVRLRVSCDHRFWVAALLRRANAAASLLLPAASMAGDFMAASHPPPPPPTDGSVLFTVPNLFLDAKLGASFRSYELPAPASFDYSKAVVEFDLLVKKFGGGNFTGVHGFRRPNERKADQVLYYGLQINNFKSRTILDLGLTDQLAKGEGATWVTGHTYHLRFTYNVDAKSITLDVFENGVKKETVSGPAHHFDLRADGHPLVVDFGMVGVGGDGGYVPPLGWQYSNLKVLLTP